MTFGDSAAGAEPCGGRGLDVGGVCVGGRGFVGWRQVRSSCCRSGATAIFILVLRAVLVFTSVLFAFYASLTPADVSDAPALRAAQPWKTLQRGN